MNAKILYDTILRLVFATLLLMILFAFIVIKEPHEMTSKEAENSETTQLIDLKEKRDPKLAKGKLLFKNNCAACHNKNLKDDLTGPALGNVSERWEAYPKEDLYNWIRNSQLMIEEGHPKAKALYEKYKLTMNAFPNLTDEEIEAMLYFCDKGAD